MFVVTRDLATKNFKVAAGMPLPAKYAGKYSRDSIERSYGRGIIMEVSHRNIDEFKSMLSKLHGTDGEKLMQLSALCDEQAKKIKSQEKEIQSLRKANPRDGTQQNAG